MNPTEKQFSTLFRLSHKHWLMLGCFVLATAGILGVASGLRSLSEGYVDLRSRWVEQSYVLHRVNPGDIFHSAPADKKAVQGRVFGVTTTEAEVSAFPSGYPPWSYLTGFLFVPPFRFEWVRLYFAALNMVALMLMLGTVLGLSRGLAPPKRWFLVAAVWAVFAHSYTLDRGQYGILVNALLLTLLLRGGNSNQILEGLALGLAALKPQMAGLFFLIPLVRGRWVAVATASGYIVAATAVICLWLGAGPITMLQQVFEQSAVWDGGDKGLVRIFRALGAERSLVILSVLVGCSAVCLGLLWWCRHRSVLVLMSIAAVMGRLWMYHQSYDDVMLIFLLIPMGLLALQRKEFPGRLLFVLVGISLWAPTWRIENYTVTAMAKVSVWLLGLGYVLYHSKASELSGPVTRSDERKSPSAPKEGSCMFASSLNPASVDIVVPVLNESASVEEFYARVARLGLGESLLFVDNASTDDTVQKIERMPGARLVRHAKNEGYGASLRDGMLAGKAPRIVIIDADLEYPPEAIPAMLTALDRETVVYGSRLHGANGLDMPLFRRIGNRVISGVFNLLFRQQTTDFYTGMKALRREALSGIVLHQTGFEHVVELGAKLACQGHTLSEIPIAYTPRSRGVSKMKHLPETIKYVWFVTRYWLKLVVLEGSKTASEAR